MEAGKDGALGIYGSNHSKKKVASFQKFDKICLMISSTSQFQNGRPFMAKNLNICINVQYPIGAYFI